MKIFNIFLFLTLIGTSYQQGCFDLSPDALTCRVCNYDYFVNSSFDWNLASFSPSICLKKQNTLQSLIYVDSSFNCSQGNQCNGSPTNPYNDLFTALETIMINTITYQNASIHIYLLGSKSHTLYTDKTSNQGFLFFKRMDLEINIETLFCSENNITGCNSNETLAEILVKRNHILFFISNRITLKKLKFNGIDMNSYNQTTDSSFKSNYANMAFCTESDLATLNSQKSICFLQKNLYFVANLAYGLFNLEILYDNPNPPTPTIIIQNCEFNYILFIQQSSSFLQSLISVTQGSPISISFENTQIDKFIASKGILSLNQNSDPYYLYVSIPTIIKSLKPGNYNLSIINTNITEFNKFNLVLNESNNIDFLAIFNFHNNQTSNLYTSFPSLNILMQNNSFHQIFNLGGINFYFFRISGFNNDSNFSLFNSDFSNSSSIFLVHIWDYSNVQIISSSVQNNWNFSLHFSDSSIYFFKTTFENISSPNSSLLYVKNQTIIMNNCSFLSCYLSHQASR